MVKFHDIVGILSATIGTRLCFEYLNKFHSFPIAIAKVFTHQMLMPFAVLAYFIGILAFPVRTTFANNSRVTAMVPLPIC